MKIKNIIAATAVTVASAVAASATTYDIMLDWNGTNVGSGSISWDETLVTAFEDGTGTLTQSQFSVFFSTIVGTFTNANDIDYPSFPELSFTNYLPTSLNYVLNDGENDVDLSSIGATYVSTSAITMLDDNLASVAVSTDATLPAVPLPAGLPLVASALGALAVLRRKKRAA